CCAERRLILELDGAIHDEQKEYDSARTEHLEAYGYTVIRFHNDDVLTNLSGVLARIASQALRLPSPRIGRGAGGEGPSEDTTLAW
ncbi:MAG TPA: DUF559 domain-containing protein, partial [Nitrolancea sp.]|nr:DUF559 domain-containing protein [Nitrolancea sp.]